MNKIIKNAENGKYFTNRYQDGFWSREIADACVFGDEESLELHIQKLRKSSDNPFDDIKMILIETIYKF